MRTVLNKVALSFSVLMFSAMAMAPPAAALEMVEKTVVIKATPRQIVDAIVKHRTAEPSIRQIVSTRKDGAVVMRETIDNPLAIARDKLVYEETIDGYLVEYHLIDAEKLTTFEGRWTMEEVKPGMTTVKLSSTVDSNLSIPFKGRILRNEASKGVERRLSYVKQQAEKLLISER